VLSPGYMLIICCLCGLILTFCGPCVSRGLHYLSVISPNLRAGFRPGIPVVFGPNSRAVFSRNVMVFSGLIVNDLLSLVVRGIVACVVHRDLKPVM
jgi:hypothetical protein